MQKSKGQEILLDPCVSDQKVYFLDFTHHGPLFWHPNRSLIILHVTSECEIELHTLSRV